MLQSVFISDLHLNPDEPAITARFYAFLNWVVTQKADVYILGDFFHAWAGDDAMDEWAIGIARTIKSVAEQGICFFFMAGNRDFLIGDAYLKLAGMKKLTEPVVIELEQSVLLAHGDRYCTLDKSHQRFRKLTRNPVFRWLFLKIPVSLRVKMVGKVRQTSKAKAYDPEKMRAIPDALIRHMRKFQAFCVIHGHTHRFAENAYESNGDIYKQFILSDWDDIPHILCYDKTMGLYFTQLNL